MLVAPIAVICDGITAWTVNLMDIVPSVVNRLAHLLFFLFMDFTIIITSRYMYDLLIGYDKTAKWKKVLLNLPGMISVLLTTVGIGTDFDPHLAQIFLANRDEVIKLMKQFQE